MGCQGDLVERDEEEPQCVGFRGRGRVAQIAVEAIDNFLCEVENGLHFRVGFQFKNDLAKKLVWAVHFFTAPNDC